LVRREVVGRKPETGNTPKDNPAKGSNVVSVIWHGVGAFAVLLAVLTVLCTGSVSWFRREFQDPPPPPAKMEPATSPGS
jgi:hypothetical protein